jgi:hypothetical protein
MGACPDGYDAMEAYHDTLSGLIKLQRPVVTPRKSDEDEVVLNDRPDFPYQSYPVQTRPFSTIHNTCFVVSKDRRHQGLSWQLARHCTGFVHVPHFCTSIRSAAEDDDRTASSISLLDLPSCLSITLYEFTACARSAYSEREFHGHKFQVAAVARPSPQDDNAQTLFRSTQRQQRLEQAAAMDHGSLSDIFSSETRSSDY